VSDCECCLLFCDTLQCDINERSFRRVILQPCSAEKNESEDTFLRNQANLYLTARSHISGDLHNLTSVCILTVGVEVTVALDQTQ
jgi:hypothetical protein